jgi:proteasome assembly chaperone (PAC2) family protein
MDKENNSDVIKLLDELPLLRNPICIAAFQGFTDRSGETVDAVKFLVKEWNAAPLAEFESEAFYDFTMNRPKVKTEQGLRKIAWPTNRIYYASPPGAERDFILFEATEPNLRWQLFTNSTLRLLEKLGCQELITFGAIPSAVPHTRPAPIQLSASEDEWERIFGLQIPGTSRYQGDIGIMSVFNLLARENGWSNASLLVQTPHYVAEMKNPRISRALLELISKGYGLTFSYDRMNDEMEIFEDRMKEALTGSNEAADYVKQLEVRYDEAAAAGELSRPAEESETDSLPATDEIMDDLEDFFKSQH